MNTTTRLLALCEEKKCCPLGLASMLLPPNPDWLDGSQYGWKATRMPDPEDAALWLNILEDDADGVATCWDEGMRLLSVGHLKLASRNKTNAIRLLVALGGFCRPPKSLTRCERRWLGAMA